MKANLELTNLINNIRGLLPLANSHMVHFITHNSFEKNLPKGIQEEVLALDVNELNKIVLSSFSTNKPTFRHQNYPNLMRYLIHLQKLSLKQNDICLSFEKLCEKLGSKDQSESSRHIVKNLMSVKKSHEVEMMSAVVAAIAKTEKCTHVVDIGGGKGYLSSVLALKHQLKVLSVDSSHITLKGAEKHMPKVEKLWKRLQKKSLSDDNAVSISDQNVKNENHSEYSQLCKLAIHFITDETDVLEMIRHHFQNDEIDNVILAGLHTCGNLAASSLRLFVENPDSIRCLVNVGCCYHLIIEEFDTDPPWLEVSSEACGIGFPMSAYLKGLGFTLGRNARMLATQSPDRISHEGMVHIDSLFYRALLELFLEKKLRPVNGMPHFRVGKLTRKCSSFSEYVHKSIKRLGIDIEVDDTELQELYESHMDTRKQLHAFFLLKLALAPVIEAVIMLDRLLFLHEQVRKGVQDAYLTQLFDPVVSPRCFAIIAYNKPSVTTTLG